MDAKVGTIFDIGRFMTEDGPGIRTTVFMKGCPLRCQWCSNAYGLSPMPQLAVNQSKCTGCGRCLNTCPYNLISREEDGKVVTDFLKCRACGDCTTICLNDAREIIGKKYTVEEVMDKILEDKDFYHRNSGGATFSGGEILLQAEFVKNVLAECKRNNLHTAIETSAFGKWEDLQQILDDTDFVFIDIKEMDDKKHRELTGQSNKRIIENISKAAAYCRKFEKDLVLRLPLVPGLNDDEQNIRATGEFVKSLGTDIELNVLPYHNLGAVKYGNIGQKYKLESLKKNSAEKLEECRNILSDVGVSFSIGGANVIKYKKYERKSDGL